jgi:hypothetical protein
VGERLLVSLEGLSSMELVHRYREETEKNNREVSIRKGKRTVAM